MTVESTSDHNDMLSCTEKLLCLKVSKGSERLRTQKKLSTLSRYSPTTFVYFLTEEMYPTLSSYLKHLSSKLNNFIPIFGIFKRQKAESPCRTIHFLYSEQ